MAFFSSSSPAAEEEATTQSEVSQEELEELSPAKRQALAFEFPKVGISPGGTPTPTPSPSEITVVEEIREVRSAAT